MKPLKEKKTQNFDPREIVFFYCECYQLATRVTRHYVIHSSFGKVSSLLKLYIFSVTCACACVTFVTFVTCSTSFI